MSEEPEVSGIKKVLKVLGIIAISLLVLVAVAFGLVVGVCALKR